MPDLDRPGLRAAIADFAAANPHLSTPAGAHHQCGRASADFIDLLLERGVLERRPADSWDWEVQEIAVIDHVSHRVARVGVTLIDWTARQYEPDAPFPKIWDDPEAKPNFARRT